MSVKITTMSIRARIRRMSSQQRAEVLEVLEKGTWFGSLPTALRASIVERSSLRDFTKGQVLSSESEAIEGLFAVLEGQVEFARWPDLDIRSLLHIAEIGFWFGEIALLSEVSPAVTVVAQTDGRLLLLPKREFERLIEEDPRHFPHFARLPISRYAELIRIFGEVLGLDGETLIRRRLVDLIELRRADRGRADQSDGAPQASDLELRISQADFAALVGLSRQSLNEHLKHLADQELIEVSYRKIRILDAEKLRGDGA